MRLSLDEINYFNDNGFLIIKNFATKSLCENILKEAKKHFNNRIEPLEVEEEYHFSSKEERIEKRDYNSHLKGRVRRLRQVYDRNPIFKEWMEYPKIRPILKQLLDDNPVLVTAHHNSIMTKMAHKNSMTRWHQDIRYWNYKGDNLLSVWLALGDENANNGSLSFIPKSHKIEFELNQFDNKEYLKERDKRNKILIDKAIQTELKEGDIVFFHSLLLHRALANQTEETKFSFVYTVKGEKIETKTDSRSSNFKEIKL